MAGNTINHNDIIWPSRRKFIKRAPIVFAGATALSMLPKVAASAMLSRSANPIISYPPPPQPTLASANGFNNLSLWDDFEGLQGFDLNNTLNPGYTWYMTIPASPDATPAGSPSTGITSPASSVSANASVLTYNPAISGFGGYISTMGYTGLSGSRYVGTTIQATGGYYEIRMAFDPTRSTANLSYPLAAWPAFFMSSLAGDLYSNDQNRSAPAGPEWDFFEHIGSQTPTPSNTILDWSCAGNINAARYFNTGRVPSYGAAAYSAMNTYGCLWIPQAKNGGTNGQIQFYFNGTLLTSGFTYSSTTVSSAASGGAPTGVFYDMDTCAGCCIKFGSGYNWPLFIDYVMAWQ